MARDLIINPLIAVLIGRRLGRHVTRSFDVRPSRFPLVFPFGRFKEPPFHAPATLSSSSIFFFDDEPRGPMAISPLQVGPLTTRRELAPGHAPLIFDREAPRTPDHQPCRPKYTSQSC